MGLDSIREKIDKIDIELQRLFEERMSLCDMVALEKKKTNAPVFQGGREQQILDNVRSRSNGFADSSTQFFADIMSISRDRQKKLLSSDITLPEGRCVNAIIACGGGSRRMGFNKLLYSLDGQCVLLRTIKKFDGIEGISRIILSVGDDFKRDVESIISTADIRTEVIITNGGDTRQQSIANAVRCVSADCEWICIHDGARPFVKAQTISACIDDAYKHGASVVCVPVKDTIKTASADGLVISTPERSTLYLAQTPQVMSLELYRKALSLAGDKEFTDDASLCEAIGVKPVITAGDYTNIKLTTQEDIELAKLLIQKGCAE